MAVKEYGRVQQRHAQELTSEQMEVDPDPGGTRCDRSGDGATCALTTTTVTQARSSRWCALLLRVLLFSHMLVLVHSGGADQVYLLPGSTTLRLHAGRCFGRYEKIAELNHEGRPTYVMSGDDDRMLWFRNGSWIVGAKSHFGTPRGDLKVADTASSPDRITNTDWKAGSSSDMLACTSTPPRFVTVERPGETCISMGLVDVHSRPLCEEAICAADNFCDNQPDVSDVTVIGLNYPYGCSTACGHRGHYNCGKFNSQSNTKKTAGDDPPWSTIVLHCHLPAMPTSKRCDDGGSKCIADLSLLNQWLDLQDGITPLMWAAALRDDAAVARLLNPREGQEVDAVDAHGNDAHAWVTHNVTGWLHLPRAIQQHISAENTIENIEARIVKAKRALEIQRLQLQSAITHVVLSADNHDRYPAEELPPEALLGWYMLGWYMRMDGTLRGAFISGATYRGGGGRYVYVDTNFAYSIFPFPEEMKAMWHVNGKWVVGFYKHVGTTNGALFVSEDVAMVPERISAIWQVTAATGDLVAAPQVRCTTKWARLQRNSVAFFLWLILIPWRAIEWPVTFIARLLLRSIYGIIPMFDGWLGKVFGSTLALLMTIGIYKYYSSSFESNMMPRPGRSDAAPLDDAISPGSAMQLGCPGSWVGRYAGKRGYAAFRLNRDACNDAPIIRAFEQMLQVPDPENLGDGRDVHDGDWQGFLPGKSLSLAGVWRIENPDMWKTYMGSQGKMRSELRRLSQAGVSLSTLQTQLSTNLQMIQLDPPLKRELNEVLLCHGTKPEHINTICSNGLDEKFCGGLYGDGIYFSDNPSKCDQYVGTDVKFKRPHASPKPARPGRSSGGAQSGRSRDQVAALHEAIYRDPADHPGKVHYLIVCRVLMGQHVRAKAARNLVKIRTRQSVWHPQAFEKELACIPNVDPPVKYHSLVVEPDCAGPTTRHFEFLQFHQQRVYPAFLVAYHRKFADGTSSPR